MSIAFRDLPVYDLTGATRNFEQLVALKLTGSLEGTLDEPTLKKPEAFKGIEALGFKNAWKNFEAGRKGEYRKNPFGTVELRGVLSSGESGKEGFVLPAGYRPKESKAYIVNANGAAGFIEVMAAGGVILVQGAAALIFLDQVSFSVE